MTILDTVVIGLVGVQLAAMAAVAVQARAMARRAAKTSTSVQKTVATHVSRVRRLAATAQDCQARVHSVQDLAHKTRGHLTLDDVPGFLITPRLIARLGRVAYGRTRKEKETAASGSVAVRILKGTGLMPPALVKALPYWRRIRPVLKVSRQLLAGGGARRSRQETQGGPTNGRP